jgi:hypothetical protein
MCCHDSLRFVTSYSVPTDWHGYLETGGFGGYHQAAAGVDDETRQTLQDLFACLDFLVKETVDLAEMASFKTTFVERLCDAERILPAGESKAIVNHLLLHVWEQL